MIPSPASLPSRDRFQGLIRFLQAALVAAVLLAAVGLFVETVAWVMVFLVVAAPLVRVAWLGVRWAGRGDRRYGLVVLALLGVILAAALATLLT